MALEIGASSPKDAPIVIACGGSLGELPANLAGKKLVLLSPARVDEAYAEGLCLNARGTTLMIGSFDEDGRLAFWRDVAAKVPTVRENSIEGVGTSIEWAWDSVIAGLRAL